MCAAEPPATAAADLPPALRANLALLDAAELALAHSLVSCGQSHLFDGWAPPGSDDAAKHRFFDQMAALDAAHPGGVRGYVERTRERAAAEPLAEWTAVEREGDGVQLAPPDGEYLELERRGEAEAVHVAFVVTAGETGEGELDVAAPTELCTGASALQLYCQHLGALQQLLKRRLGRAVVLPLLLVAPDEALPRLEQLLAAHSHFGLLPSQLTLLRQPRAPAFAGGGGARLARDGPYAVRSHALGGGAVHALLASSGLAGRWAREGVRWLLFLHDAAPLHPSTCLATLGAAAAKQLDLAFAATPRRAHAGVDVLARLRHADGQRTLLVPLDEAALPPRCGKLPSYSHAFLARLEPYAQTLRLTAGVVREVARADGGCVRLVARVQDYAWLPAAAAAGYVCHPAEFGHTPCGQSLAAGAARSAKGLPACAAASGEMAVYLAHCAALRLLGAHVPPPRERAFHGVVVPLGACVVLHPSFAPSLAALRHKLLTPAALSVSERSTLLVRGRHLVIERLSLDGALELSVAECASLRVRSLHVANEGWQFDEISEGVLRGGEVPPLLARRGYTLRKRAQRRLVVSQPGAYEVVDGELRRVAAEKESFHPPASPREAPRGGAAFGGPLQGSLPPPAAAVWSSSALELSPGAALSVPLVLREPSLVSIEVKPNRAGLWHALLPKEGEPVLPFGAVYVGAPAEEVHVPGSGVYTVQLENRNLLSSVCFSARVAHEPAADCARAALQRTLAARHEELRLVVQQDSELAASEAELARRLWEVQETRRRHEAMQRQLQASIREISELL
ncbi:hypothetical protein AB1Y20_022989 [Prymnesium parvum]|uniref:Uncharacterized protein n=1 Tax=Prymnesium parvum TaxID=97485 RepID=A0AB34JCK7_PRYPA